MTNRRRQTSGDGENRVLWSILADPRQRRILSILRERSRSITDRDLAVSLLAREEEKHPSDIAEEDLQQVLVDLHHRYLPKLETVGWIERHPDGRVTTERLPFENTDPSLRSLQDSDLRWETLTPLLARPRRLHVVSTLARHDQTLTLEELAGELAASEGIRWTTDRDGDDTAIASTLHHVDLPRLEEIGLIKYDPEVKTITREPALTAVVDSAFFGDRIKADFDTGSES